MSVATTWGTTPDEREMAFPCDRFMEQPDAVYYRGITIRAQPEVIFRWLCQMRVAPYSYDWIDNLGRQSPRALTPGLEEWAIGQTLMGGFELVDFEHGRHLTGRVKQHTLAVRAFGQMAASHLIVPQTSSGCRLLVKIVAKFRRGPIGWVLRVLLPWGDLIMMRKQLLNFKMLSEQATDTPSPAVLGTSMAREASNSSESREVE